MGWGGSSFTEWPSKRKWPSHNEGDRDQNPERKDTKLDYQPTEQVTIDSKSEQHRAKFEFFVLLRSASLLGKVVGKAEWARWADVSREPAQAAKSNASGKSTRIRKRETWLELRSFLPDSRIRIVWSEENRAARCRLSEGGGRTRRQVSGEMGDNSFFRRVEYIPAKGYRSLI